MQFHLVPQILKSPFVALTLLFFGLLTVRLAVAEERSIDPSSEFILMGNSYLNNSEIVLTNDTNWQDGRIQTKQTICAKEYKFSYDAFVGDLNADKNGGAGVVFYEIRSDDNSWLNVFEFNIQDRARISRFNTIEMLGTAPITFAVPAFTLAGNGWNHVVFHGNENVGDAVVSNAKGVVSVANGRPYKQGVPIYHQFLGWTGTAHNLQKVKNFKIEIIRPDNCTGLPSLTLDEAKQQITASCGSNECSSYATFLTCAVNFLDTLKSKNSITVDTYNSLLTEYQAKANYCDGVGECSSELEKAKQDAYARGFTEGIASIDIEAIKSDARAEGYESGFSDGVASVDVQSIKNEAYQTGKDAGYQEGYSAGYNAGLSVDKVTICHKQPKKNPVTITVSRNALKAHLAHGDSIGKCNNDKLTKK